MNPETGGFDWLTEICELKRLFEISVCMKYLKTNS